MASSISELPQSDFQYPKCWDNNERMTVLFAPFRPKTINPTDWETKMKFWEDLIDQWCKSNKQFLISQDDITNRFQRNGKSATCLSEVFQNLHRNGVIVSQSAFNKMTEKNVSPWILNKLVSYTWSWIFPSVLKSDENYLHIPTIELLAESVVKSLPAELRGRLLDEKYLFKLSGVKSMEELKLLLQYLENQKKVAVTKEMYPLVLYKFSKVGEKNVSVNKVDTGIYQLQLLEEKLTSNIEQLENDKEGALTKTKMYLASNKRSMAKTSLRKKKEIEKYIEKRASALDNIQQLLLRLQQTEVESEVLKCYQIGTKALQETLKINGLTHDFVNSTMDQLEDVLDDYKEIDEALSRSLSPSLDNELEEELKNLLEEDPPSGKPQYPPSTQPEDKSKTNNVFDFGVASAAISNELPSGVILPEVPKSDPEDTEDDLILRLKALTS